MIKCACKQRFTTIRFSSRLTDDARSQDGGVLEELVRHDRVLGVLRVPETEAGEDDEPDDDHGDHARIVPLAIGQGSQGEGQEDESKRSGDEEQTDKVHLVGNVVEDGPDGFTGKRTGGGDLVLVHLLGLDLSPEHDPDNRSQTSRDL